MESVEARDLDPIEESDIDVIRWLRCGADGTGWVSSESACPLVEFLDTLPEPMSKARGEEASGRAASSHPDALLLKYPWLKQYWDKQPLDHGPSRAKKASKGATEAEAQGAVDVEAMDDEELDALFAEVDRKWAEQAHDNAATLGNNDFRVTVLKGKWTLEAKGVVADAISAQARTLYAKAFCESRGMPRSFRAEIGTYGWGVANTLCVAWATKMQFFFNLATKFGDPCHKFTGPQLASFKEPAGFTEAALALVGHKDGVKRVNVVRGLFA